MKEIKLEEQRSIQVEVLKDVHKFCTEHKITYFLAYGTLLGAIRHKGYIPWDDDIDIIMPRSDYERFFKTYGNETYEALDYKKDKTYPYPFGKISDKRTILKEEKIRFDLENGIYIDVFPLDGITENIKKAQMLFKRMQILKTIMTLKLKRIRGLKRSLCRQVLFVTLQGIVCFIPYKWVLKKIDYLAQTASNNPHNNYAGVLVENDNHLSIYPKITSYKDLILVDFEQYQFYAPKEYDKILKSNYGNYMELPPEEERVPHHLCKMWWK